MKSIRRNLTAILLFGCLLLLGTGGALICLFARTVLVEEFDGSLQTAAATLADLTRQTRQIEFTLPPDSGDAPAQPAAQFFEFRLVDGRVLKRSASLGGADLPFRFGAGNGRQYWNLTLPNGAPGRAVGITYIPRVQKTGLHRTVTPLEVVLVVARDRSALDHTIRSLVEVLALAVVVLSIGIVGVVRFAVRRGLRPLEKVADQVAAINASSLQFRFATEAPAELQPIVSRLNDLLSRIEQSFHRERRFSADVAHELRTPIAEMRSLAEVALKWPDDATTTRRAFQDALDAARQMESIVTGLLTLARSEMVRDPVAVETVDVSRLVNEAWTPLAGKAAAKKLAVTFDISKPVTLATEATMFRAILANLFDNAVEYTPAAGVVRIEAKHDDGHFVISVRNTNETLRSDDLDHLFERFWRKDSARSDARHSGLGLALTKSFAERLSLRIRASLEDSSMLVMTLTNS